MSLRDYGLCFNLLHSSLDRHIVIVELYAYISYCHNRPHKIINYVVYIQYY